MFIPKYFYKTGGSKTCIPKNLYTKTTYSLLLSKKFGESVTPSHPQYATPIKENSSLSKQYHKSDGLQNYV
ncbi:hypothetical protein Hanom_Chr15g01380691 [Helianthus anomalus]